MSVQTCILVGAPVDSGKRRAGCLMGPDAFRTAGLAEALRALGHGVEDRGNLAPDTHAPDAADARIYQHQRTIGWTRALTRAAEQRFAALGIHNVTVLTGDGCFGLPDQAPFDRILVTAAAEDPPGPLLAQLKEGGTMVVPVGQSDAVQSLIKVTRDAGGFHYHELTPVRFVPLVEGTAND